MHWSDAMRHNEHKNCWYLDRIWCRTIIHGKLLSEAIILNQRIILCMHPANERRYIATSSLNGGAHTQNDPCEFIPYCRGLLQIVAKLVTHHIVKLIIIQNVPSLFANSLSPTGTHISWNIFWLGIIMILSLWNLTGILAVLLPSCRATCLISEWLM